MNRRIHWLNWFSVSLLMTFISLNHTLSLLNFYSTKIQWRLWQRPPKTSMKWIWFWKGGKPRQSPKKQGITITRGKEDQILYSQRFTKQAKELHCWTVKSLPNLRRVCSKFGKLRGLKSSKFTDFPVKTFSQLHKMLWIRENLWNTLNYVRGVNDHMCGGFNREYLLITRALADKWIPSAYKSKAWKCGNGNVELVILGRVWISLTCDIPNVTQLSISANWRSHNTIEAEPMPWKGQNEFYVYYRSQMTSQANTKEKAKDLQVKRNGSHYQTCIEPYSGEQRKLHGSKIYSKRIIQPFQARSESR